MRKPGDFWLRLLGIFGGLAILLAAMMLVAVDHSRRKLENYRLSIEKRGEKFAIESLAPPQPGQEGNGARAMIDAAKEINRIAKEKDLRRIATGQRMEKKWGYWEVYHQRPTAMANPRKGSKGLTEEISWEEVSANLVDLAPVLETLRRASNSPHLEFHPNYKLGMNIPLGDVTVFLGAAQFLGQQNVLLLHEGKVSAAVDNTIAMLRISQMLGRQPILISQLVDQSALRMAAGATWEILQAKGVDPAELKRLQAAWEEANPVEHLKDTLRMERAGALPLFEQAEETLKVMTGGKGPSSFSLSSPSLSDLQSLAEQTAWNTFFRYSDELEFIRSFQSMLDHVPVGNESWKAFEETVVENQHALENAGLSRMFSRTLISSLDSTMLRFPGTEAVRRLCMAAIAIRRYQLDQGGKAPSLLTELVPTYLTEVPLDPMDGKPLRYKVDGASDYWLYSIGKDGVDGGGDAGTVPGKTASDFTDRVDIVWPRAVQP